MELRAHFVYNNAGVGNHECLVFEMLSSNLYTLLEQVQFHGFSLPLVRKFAESLLNSLKFLARPDVRVIHTDIKPENICIRNPRRSAIKLIDFGSSCTEGQQMFSYIQSRYYRSPEVLLGNGYTVAIDMWASVRALEMHVGYPLFSGDNQIDQIRKIVQICGPPPDDMIDASLRSAQVFGPGPGGGGVVVQHQHQHQHQHQRGAAAAVTGERGARRRMRRDAGYPGPRQRVVHARLGAGREQRRPPLALGQRGRPHAAGLRAVPGPHLDARLRPAERLTPAAGLTHPFITQDYEGSPAQVMAASSSSATSSSSSSSNSSSSAPRVADAWTRTARTTRQRQHPRYRRRPSRRRQYG